MIENENIKDMIQHAEKNLLNVIKEFEILVKITNALSEAGHKYCHHHIAKKDYFDAIQKLRNAIDRELCYSIYNLFLFSYIGDKEVKKYSYKKFKEYFSEESQHMIMHLLDEFGQYPSWWDKNISDEFKRQAREKIEKFKELDN